MIRPTASMFLAALICLATTSMAAAALTHDQRVAVFEEGLAAYDAGMNSRANDGSAAANLFSDAVARFERLIDDGVRSRDVLYNLGNAHYQRGDIGRAILNYRRAHAVDPNDDRVAMNLEAARSLRTTQLLSNESGTLQGTVARFVRAGSPRTRRTLFLVAWMLFWFCIIMRSHAARGPWTTCAVLSGAAVMAVGAAIAVQRFYPPANFGVTLAASPVHKGNGAGYPRAFAEPLSPGVEFTIQEERGAWWSIELPDGSTGWIAADTAEAVEPGTDDQE